MYTKLYYKLLALIIFIKLIIFKILKKKIFLSRINNIRIGHFLIESELHLLEKKAKQLKNATYYYYLTPFASSCNFFLEKIIKRNFKIIPSLLGLYVDRIDSFFFNKTKIKITKCVEFSTNDKNSLLNKFNTQLVFLNEEIVEGEKILNRIGLKNKKFVCILNRDESYLKKNFKKDYSHHSYRNSNIENYLEASNFLASKNIYSVRMGKNTDFKLNSKNDFIIDYANSDYRSDFLDLYLSYKCFFWIGGDAGVQLAAKVYRKPIISVNRAPLFQPNWSGISKNTNITIFKKYYDKIEKKYLSISEIKKKKVGHLISTLDYEKNNINLIQNSPYEILLATKQMYETLDNTFVKTDEYKIIEKKFWELYGIENYNDERVSDICYEFLIKNKYLLC